jgi:hypothetical protein
VELYDGPRNSDDTPKEAVRYGRRGYGRRGRANLLGSLWGVVAKKHLAYQRARNNSGTRCGAGEASDAVNDLDRVTCEACLYWAHRGYTAPHQAQRREVQRERGKIASVITRAGLTKPAAACNNPVKGVAHSIRPHAPGAPGRAIRSSRVDL